MDSMLLVAAAVGFLLLFIAAQCFFWPLTDHLFDAGERFWNWVFRR